MEHKTDEPEIHVTQTEITQEINSFLETAKISFTKDQLSMLNKMKQEYGYNDEILNQFKLMIYNWNINDVRKHYNNDSFCCDYCIDYNNKYGCTKQKNQCPFEHSKTFNLNNLIYGNSKQQNYKMAKLLCLYLMNKKVYNNNSHLFLFYGDLLTRTGTTMQDYLKSEQYYVKSLSIDNNNGSAHNNYAILLDYNLNNFDKAEYHYKKALEIHPTSATRNYNLARFLKKRQHKYNQSLIYINKACKLQPNASDNHELKGQILYLLNRFGESIDVTVHALKLNENDGSMTNNRNVNNAKQLIEHAIEQYMIQQLQMQTYLNIKEFEGSKLMVWLYDNQLLSIKDEILSNEISMKILVKCLEKDLDDLVKEMKLKTTAKIKFRKAFQNLQQRQQENKNAESKEDSTTLTTTAMTNLVSPHEQFDESKIGDSVSVSSGISAISAPFVVNCALIVFLGIGDYEDKLQNLPGVSKDYQNILNTFVETWGYTAFYKTDKNITIYSNEIETVKLNNNYKLHWTIDEIEKFVEEARMYVVFNKHNGLIFVISSHGDTGKIIYDSKMEEYALSDIFNMFQPQWGQLLETYKETPQVSKRLFQIPKIFCIDSCRGSSSAKIVNTKPDEKEEETVAAKGNVNNSHNSDSNKGNTKKSEFDSEKISLKVVSKKKAEVLSTNYSNFCKIWANVDGYAVADGSMNGGLFLRNVSKLFGHKKWILNHNLNDIIFKIRDYTKREATLIGLVNFTQLVENEGTMERPVRFDVFKENVVYRMPQEFLDEVEAIDDEEDDELDKIVITNLSPTDKIAVLVENEQSNEDRTQLLESLLANKAKDGEKDNGDLLFTSKGYQLIAPVSVKQGVESQIGSGIGSESVKFIKTWDYTFVTLINVTKKEIVCDRKRYFEDYLYFEDDFLQQLSQYKPKCNNNHYLKEVNTIGGDNHKFQCDNCASQKSNVYFHCYKCKYSLCQSCCHLKICVKNQQQK